MAVVNVELVNPRLLLTNHLRGYRESPLTWAALSNVLITVTNYNHWQTGCGAGLAH